MVKIGNIELGGFPLLLAPMEDVSDPPFRFVCKMNGADLMYTEFISSEGLIRDAVKSKKKLDIFEHERPIGIQFYGGNIDSMKQATEIISAVQPDLIDINYGCPVKNVACKGAGAGLLQDVNKMVMITKEVVKSTKLPVTVKTRLGWDDTTKNIVEVAERLQDVGIQAITIHGRTRKQLYKGPADWTLIGEVKNNPRMKIPVFGNGDVDSPKRALEMKNKYGVDGIMIGRAAIGNPWIFREIKTAMKHWNNGMLDFIPAKPTIEERVHTAKIHLQKSIEWKGERHGILEMRRHYANYFKGFPDFKEYRMKLVTSLSADELYMLLDEIKEKYTLSEKFVFENVYLMNLSLQ
jgi:nifR3 family TIM-barrel protein